MNVAKIIGIIIQRKIKIITRVIIKVMTTIKILTLMIQIVTASLLNSIIILIKMNAFMKKFLITMMKIDIIIIHIIKTILILMNLFIIINYWMILIILEVNTEKQIWILSLANTPIIAIGLLSKKISYLKVF